MVENKDIPSHDGQIVEKITPKSFLLDMVRGYFIGVAFIIPGFSGGSIATIIGVYEKLINSIVGLFTSFKKSFLTLLPIFLGLCVGVVSLLYPLGWALDNFPIPTVALFVGLALGALSPVRANIEGKIDVYKIVAFSVPAIIALLLVFIPTGADVDLLNLNFPGYIILFLVGILASAALVIPGISGSMILLILGFYNPIISIITDHFLRGENMLTAILVLMSTGLGIIVGFIAISVIMKHLLKNKRSLTYTAILGFIIGSAPTAFVSTAKDAGYTLTNLPEDPIYWIASVVMLALGIGASVLIVKLATKNNDITKGEEVKEKPDAV